MHQYNHPLSMKHRTLFALLSTVFFYLIAHGYRVVNNIFSHDSLLQVYQDDSAWQIALGRFFYPILLLLRGGLASPWLIGFCALFWLSLSVILITGLLDLKFPLSIVITAGVMVCHPTLTCVNAGFLHNIDFYALSLFLSILGVFLCVQKKKLLTLAGILSMALSMGTYQSYICVSIGLFMILLLQELLQKEDSMPTIRKALGYCLCLILCAFLYFSIWKVFQKVFHIWTANTYNGLASVGDYSDTSFFAILLRTYQRFFDFFWNPPYFSTMKYNGSSLSFLWVILLRFSFLMVLACILLCIINAVKKHKVSPLSILLLCLGITLFPLGLNFVCILSKDMEHTLMMYAFCLLYVFAVVLMENYLLRNTLHKPISLSLSVCLPQGMLFLALLCVIWSNVVYANQVYLKKTLQDKAVTSLMTRMVSDMEHMPGYHPGETPVAISGHFENSPYLRQLPGFEEIIPYGMGNTSLTYMGTDYAFLRYELNVPINETRVYANTPKVLAMPCYPLEGSIAYVDDILVIKVSP